MHKREDPLDPYEPAVTAWPLALLRIALRLAALVLIVVGVHWTLTWLDERTHVIGASQGLALGIILLMLVAYALMIALPFVPGIEIGIALMMLQGGSIAPFVYLATIVGLFTAYTAGMVLPYRSLHRLAADLRLSPLCRMLERIAVLSPEERLVALQARLPSRLGGFATRHRYILLGIVVNVPGNGVVGGGGGLCLMAGLSRLYEPVRTAALLAVAVAPVPLIVWLVDRPPLGFLPG